METDCRRIVEMSLDAIISADESDTVILWNPAAERMFGYLEREALGMSVKRLMPEEYRERHALGLERFRETGVPTIIGRTVEVEGLRKDGSRFPLEISLSAERGKGGWVFTGILRDITVRKKIEERITWQTGKLQEMNSELSALYGVSSALGRTIGLEELLLNILETTTSIELFKIERAGGIFLVEGDRLRLAAHLGHSADFLKKHIHIVVGECLCGIAAETGEIVISGNSDEDKRHTIRYSGITVHGHIIVPLKAKGRVLGVLYLYLPPGARVAEDKKELLEAIGSQLGMAIHNSKLYEETKALTFLDPLTGLANRRFLYMELKRYVAQARRLGNALSAVMMDIDHFKKYNDDFGHPAGDRVLRGLAGFFLKAFREMDIVARYGGEEFLVLMPDTDLTGAHVAAERVRRDVEKGFALTISLGIATFSKEMKGGDELIKLADTALYSAKKKGRNRVERCA